jgi:glycosyltransferase involved in cell wall biosynthesis
LGLRERARLVGERAEADLGPFYAGADLFVLASYHEGYGMALTEALARGLPVVATTAGAIPDTVPDGAGLLVAPGDPRALAAALCRVMSEPALRAELMAGARAARRRLPGWGDAAGAFAAELAGLARSAK